MPKTINWDQSKFALLQAAAKAHKGPAPFKLILKPEGEIELDPGYAKYLIEYLSEQFAVPAPAAQPQNQGDQSYVPGTGSWL